MCVKSSMNVSVAKRSSAGRLKAARTIGSAALVSEGQIGDGAVQRRGCSMPHQMLPAPGVYDALITLLEMTVSACTTPLNFDMPAFTVTMLADTSSMLAFTVT